MAAALASLASCQQEPAVYVSDSSIVLDRNTATAAFEGTELTVKVTSNVDWEASADVDWLEIEPSAGKASSEGVDVRISVAANADEQRKAVVSFSGNDYSSSIVIRQRGYEAPVPEEPVADLLDVVFNNDGSAYDVSRMKMKVDHVSGPMTSCYYNETYDRYVAHFGHQNGKNVSNGYYKVDFADDKEFQNALADGHSMEMLIRMDVASNGSAEIKPFSNMQSGGTGFLVTKSNQGVELTFLPNVSVNGKSTWRWTKSGIVPEAGVYYHVVGVWDKDAGKSYIYVDGKKVGEADAPGELRWPNSGSFWFCIGADAEATSASCSFNGDVAIARIYDDALTEEDARKLFDRISVATQPDFVNVTDVVFMPKCQVVKNAFYNIFGKGFLAGDKVRLESVINANVNFDCDAQVTEECLKVMIPDGFVDGSYRIILKRGNAILPLGNANLSIAENIEAVRKVGIVAHRGYHPDNVTENSLASLIEAQKLGVYGSEFDVYSTVDSVVVCYHDAKINDKRIDASTYAEIKDFKLANGETLPTLDDYLDQAKLYPDMRLILEVKNHATTKQSIAAARYCVKAVKAKGLESQVDYIAFDYEVCKTFAALMPQADVMYLNGDKAPSVVHSDGINGISYQTGKLTDSWIESANKLGMTVNVWTVNSISDMLNYISKGVDLITTDDAAAGMQLIDRDYVTAQ